jgi:glucosamine--fructose-6-phosphate aminotransferase (isomerizing)
MQVEPDSLLAEIYEQPQAIERTLEATAEAAWEIAQRIRERNVGVVVIAGRGSSDNAAHFGRYIIESVNHLPVSLAAPSLFTLYRSPPRLDQAVVIAASQSGESTDVLEVARNARRQGALTVAITNEPRSALARACEHALVTRAGPEQSVPATKSYTCQLALFALLSCALADDRRSLARLRRAPAYVTAVLECEPDLRGAAAAYRSMKRCAVLSRGYNMSTAMEVALKIKETSYLQAEPYSMADFLHGPVAMVEPAFDVLLIAPSGVALKSLRESADRIRRAGARMLVFSDDPAVLQMAYAPVALPRGFPELLSPILYTVAGQLFAYHLARARGLDPVRPRGLRKVTATL